MKNKERMTFLTHVSHELRTPMNAILTFTELAMQSKSLSEIQGYLQEVHKASAELMHMINENLEGVEKEKKWIQSQMNQEESENSDSIEKVMKQLDTKAHVLIVDDNEVNLRVACALLEQYGLAPDVAASSFEALWKVAEKQYQLILMDYMMPGISGTEIMLNIRNSYGNYRNVPFVVLTANAIEGAREQMLQEGFDDYLSKPIYREFLEEILTKWLSSPIPGIQMQAGIQNCGGDVEIYQSILKFIVENGLEREKELQHFLQAEDFENYTIAVHALKSTFANIGAIQQSEMARNLEMAGKEGKFDVIREGHAPLMQEYREVLEHIGKYLENLSEFAEDMENQELGDWGTLQENAEQISREEITFLLEDVASLLEAYHYADAENVMKEMLEFQMEEEERLKLKEIYKDIANLRVEEALAKIEGF